MSAPNTAYFQNDGVNLLLSKVAVASKSVKFPLLTAAYPTPSDFKGKFYCDYLFEVFAKKDSAGTVVKVLVAGVTEGGGFSRYHNDNRFSNLMFKHKDGSGTITNVVILNDGALNTKGDAKFIAAISTVFNNIEVNVSYHSSYFASSLAYGIKYRYRNAEDTSWGSWSTLDLQPTDGAIAQDTSLDTIVSVPSPGSPFRKVQVVPFHTNAEGTLEDIGTYILELQLVSVLLENNSSWTNSPSPYYIDSENIITKENGGAVQLYANVDKTGQVLTPISKLWEDSRFYYTFGYDVESDKYIFLQRIDTTPPAPSTWNYKGYSSLSQTDADDQVIYGTGTVGTLYYKESDNTWHVSWSVGTFGPIAADGYYADGDASGVTDQKYLLGGIQQ